MAQLLVGGITVLLGLYMAWNIGANDFANSMADAVGSGAIRIRTAVILGALFEFAGSSLVGTHVTDTVRRGIVDPAGFEAFPELLLLGMICALLGTSLWLNLATWLGMPVSTTHAIVGAVAGVGIVSVGWASVEWKRMVGIILSWVISPIAGGLLAFGIFTLIGRLVLGHERPVARAVLYAPLVVFCVVIVVFFSVLHKGLTHVLGRSGLLAGGRAAVPLSLAIGALAALVSRVLISRFLRGNETAPLSEQLRHIERVFAPLVVLTSCSVAFAHGANDVANAIGPVAAVFDILRTGTVLMRSGVPLWILALGGAGIVVGLSTFGYRVLATIGTRITQLTPSRGVSADLATVTTVLVCTLLKLPVSTTHTVVGAVIGIGLARGLGAVNRRVIGDILKSWFVTVPAAALLSAGLFTAARLLRLDSLIRSALPP